MKTLMLTITEVRLLAAVAFWFAVLWIGCQVSSECREMRAEFRTTGRGVEPLDATLDRLDAVHAELFGAE